MRGVDTNVLVRYLTQDDRKQLARVNSFFAQMERAGEPAYVSIIVLCELAWVLRSLYGLKQREIGSALEVLLNTAQLTIEDRGTVQRALTLYGAGVGDFADYIVGLRNRQAGCLDTLTFDRALAESELFAVL
jgi:predicted nucleic-acid-binding protein